MTVCPCGGLPAGTSYESCCEPALTNQQWPQTAEALMRSRYTAFVKRADDHLFRTWHPRTRPADPTSDTDTQWTGLSVLATEAGSAQDEYGVVEFVANYVAHGKPGSLHEVSLFERRAGRWVYLAARPDH